MIEGLPEWSKSQWRMAAKSVRGERHSVYTDTSKMASLFIQAVNPDPGAVIAAYWPIGDELDIKPMLEELTKKEYTLALPRIAQDNRDLDFYEWKWGDPLERGFFSLSQPLPDASKKRKPDIFLVPMLAFDRTGTRLGYGLGHFDYALEERKDALKIGMAYDEQETSCPLPCDEHDVRLDAILTPKYFLRIT